MAPADVDQVCSYSDFWVEVLWCWSKLHSKEYYAGSEILKEVIWGNCNFKINGQILVNKTAIDNGLVYIEDIIHDSTKDMSTYVEMCHKYGSCMNWLSYYGLVKLIECTSKYLFKSTAVDEEGDRLLVNNILAYKKAAQMVYNLYISKNAKDVMCPYFHSHVLAFQLEDFDMDMHLTLYKNILHKWKISTSPQCDYCTLVQTVKHLFWECQIVKNFWENFNDYFIYAASSNQAVCTYQQLIELNWQSPVSHILNFCLLVTKQYIYSCKCTKNKPSFEAFLEKLRYVHRLELFNVRRGNKVENHQSKWQLIFPQNENQ